MDTPEQSKNAICIRYVRCLDRLVATAPTRTAPWTTLVLESVQKRDGHGVGVDMVENPCVKKNNDVYYAPRWPLSKLGTMILLALGDQALSIRRLSEVTGSYYKAVTSELKVLNKAGWVREINGASGPHRFHVLTEDGEEILAILRRIEIALNSRFGANE